MSDHWTSLSHGHISGAALTTPEDVTGGDGLAGLEEVSPAQNLRYSAVRENATLMTAVFEWEGGTTKSTSFPSDELVLVLEGTSHFINPDRSIVQSFSAGQWFLVPGGWIGEWAGEGLFREFAIVPPVRWNAMFDADAPTEILDRLAAPLVVDISQLVADHGGAGSVDPIRITELHSGDLDVRLFSASESGIVEPDVEGVDVLVSVLSGSAVLRSAGGDELLIEPGLSAVVHENSGVSITLNDRSSALITHAPVIALPATRTEV